MCETSRDRSLKPDRRVSSQAARSRTAMAAQEHKTQLFLECRHGHPPLQDGRALLLVCPLMHPPPSNSNMIESFSLLLFTKHLLVFVRVILTLVSRNTVPAVSARLATFTMFQQHRLTTVCHQLQMCSLTIVLTLLGATQSTTLLDVHHMQPAHLLFLRPASHPQMHSSTQPLLHL
jgi:hypothetical protein